MPLPSTMTPIATNTLAASVTSISFSNLPQGYTDLVLIAAPLTSSAQEMVMQFNGDTSAIYSSTILWGDGSSAGSYRSTNLNSILLNYYASVAGTQSNQIFNIMNYSNATTNKTVVGRANRTDSGVDATVGLWRSTATITSVELKLKNGGSFTSGSTFTLYGVKAAS